MQSFVKRGGSPDETFEQLLLEDLRMVRSEYLKAVAQVRVLQRAVAVSDRKLQLLEELIGLEQEQPEL